MNVDGYEMPPWSATIHGKCKMIDQDRTDETTSDCPTSKRLERLRTVTAIAESPGNADYHPYLQGMANGLLLARHIMEAPEDYEGDPPYVDAPETWLCEKQNEPMGEFHGSLKTIRPTS